MEEGAEKWQTGAAMSRRFRWLELRGFHAER
jgi:hypothetical protein